MSENRKGSYTRVAPDGLKEGVTEVTSTLEAKVHRAATGETEDLGVVCRMKVTAAFVNSLVQAMANQTVYKDLIKTFKYHEWGEGTTAEANTDTRCESWKTTAGVGAPSYVLDEGSQTYGAASYTTAVTLTATGAASITEHCVHPTSACGVNGASRDVLGMDRSVFPVITLAAYDSITFTYTLNVPAES